MELERVKWVYLKLKERRFALFHIALFNKGVMIAFGLRMLNAELPQYLGKTEETISKLSCLLKKVNDVILTNNEMNNQSMVLFYGFLNFLCYNY
jgi:hypothetical protein